MEALKDYLDIAVFTVLGLMSIAAIGVGIERIGFYKKSRDFNF